MTDFERLDVVWYAVTDWERAKRFYERTLGLRPTFGMAEAGWQQYAVGENGSELGIARADTVAAGGGAVAVLAVPDVEAARRRLVARGVPCEDVVEIPGVVRLCLFRDPDGNRLQLCQRV